MVIDLVLDYAHTERKPFITLVSVADTKSEAQALFGCEGKDISQSDLDFACVLKAKKQGNGEHHPQATHLRPPAFFFPIENSLF